MRTQRLMITILAAIPLGLIGTAAAQNGGETYGGESYGGVTYGAAPAPAPIAVTAPEEAAPPAATPTPAEEPEPYVPPSEPRTESILERWGAAMALGGGVDSFVHTGTTNTDPGGGWNVRALLGTKTMFGVEAAYIGSAQNIDAIGLDSSAVLVGNGAEGMLRLNATPESKLGVLLLGGVAWRHYALTNESFNTSDVQDADDVLEIPVAAGLQYDYRGMLVGARAEYRFTNYGDLMGPDASSKDAMDRWGVNANVGYRF